MPFGNTVQLPTLARFSRDHPQRASSGPLRGVGTLALPKPERLLVQRCNFRPDTRFNKTNFKTSALQLPPRFLCLAGRPLQWPATESSPRPDRPHNGKRPTSAVPTCSRRPLRLLPGAHARANLPALRRGRPLSRGWARPQRTAGS